eukprot:155529_1
MTIGKHLTPQVEEVNDLRERGMLSTQINHQHNGQNVLLRRKIKIAQHIGGTKHTHIPTYNPTKIPTLNPSGYPTQTPTHIPSENPTFNPSKQPTLNPSENPPSKP